MMTPEISRSRDGRRFTVTATPDGWAVREEDDHHVIRAVTYGDWHRVERATQVFERSAAQGAADSTNR